MSQKTIDEYIRKIHPFGILDPCRHPPWKLKDCLIYLLWFPIEFPLTLFMCIVGMFLAGYGWLKLKKNTKIKTKSLNKSNTISDNNFISVIVSCFNESDNIELCLLYLEKYFQGNISEKKNNIEIILVDGGSTDGWIDKLENGLLAQKQSIINIPIKIIKYSKHKCSGRGICQNIGVKYSNKKSNIYLFIHADTVLFRGYNKVVINKLKSNVVIGSFKFTVNRSLLNYPLCGIGCMELFARFRNNLYWLPYGDQGYFIQSYVFKNILKGFDNKLILMEDLVLTSNARKYALKTNNIIYVDNNNAYCSPRRWQKNGVTKNTMWNQIIVFCYSYLHYSPTDCYKLYYGVEPPVNNNRDITFDDNDNDD